MASINKVMLLGRLAKEAEVKTIGDKQVVSFSMATSERFKGQDGNYTENTEWHNVEYWTNGGIAQYLLKGTEVFVEGSIKTSKWQGQDGEQKERKYIRATNMQIVSKKEQTQAPADNDLPC